MLVMTARGNFTFNWIFQFWDQIYPSIIFKINELDLLWVPNFIAMRMYFIFGTKFSWNKGIDTCQIDLMSNVCSLVVILIFFGGYLVVTARYLVVTARYYSLPGARYLVVTGGYCSLLAFTSRYRSLLLVPTFSMNQRRLELYHYPLYARNDWSRIWTLDGEPSSEFTHIK